MAADLGRLLTLDLNAPLSVSEVVREIGNDTAVVDALARLDGAGLVHRCGHFVFSTTAARRFEALGQGACPRGRSAEDHPARKPVPRYYDELGEPF
jgi:hypothetical protein